MRPRGTVESYWSVWVLNTEAYEPMWEPYTEGFTTARAARMYLSAKRDMYPNERFAIVKTVHTRLRTAQPVTSKERR